MRVATFFDRLVALPSIILSRGGCWWYEREHFTHSSRVPPRAPHLHGREKAENSFPTSQKDVVTKYVYRKRTTFARRTSG